MSHRKHKVKVGRKGRRVASAVAVCAITGVMFSGSANAATTWRLGSTISSPSLQGTIYYAATANSYNYGIPLGTLETTITNSAGQSTTLLTGTIRVGTFIGNEFAALGTVNLNPTAINLDPDGSTYYAGDDSYILGSGATVKATFAGIAAGGTQAGANVTGQYTPTSYTYQFSNPTGYYYNGTSWVFGFFGPLGSETTSTYIGNGSYSGTYRYGNYEYSTYSYVSTTWTGSIGAASTTNAYAISTTGTVTLNGNGTIDGTATAGTFNIDGSNNNFNGTATADQFNISGSDNYFHGNVTVTGGGTLAFTSAGSATFADSADLTGNVSFGLHDATLTLSDHSDVTGSITGTGTDNGMLTFEGSSIITGTVGPIKDINVGQDASRVQLNTVSGTTTVNNLAITADKAVVEVGGLLSATSVTMGGHFSKLELKDRASSYSAPTVTGQAVGASYLTTYEARGMTGMLDFGIASSTQGKGTLEVGDNVNVTFSTNPLLGITALHANNATLVFAGSSSVGGNLGTSASSSDTFNRIWAGATGETVTFQNDIYVGVNPATAGTAGFLSGSDTHTGSLNVGSGTVNLNGNLYGNLVFGSGGSYAPVSVEGSAYTGYGDGSIGGTWEYGINNDGIVNIAHNKTVSGTTITTNLTHHGTLNFMGSSSYSGTIGAESTVLEKVTFNSASTGSATTGFTAAIGGNVYAHHVTIGNGNGELKPVALTDITGAFDYTGATAMQGWTGGTVANIAPGVTRLGNDLVLNNEHDAINFGLAHVTANTFTTNSGALSFTVNSLDLTGVDHAASTPDASSLLTLSDVLTMTGDENVQVNYTGSLANGGSYTLIKTGAASGTPRDLGTEGGGNVFDNSFSIDSSVRQATVASSGIDVGDLIVTANRTGGNQNYIQKSGTLGSFTNNAGIVLGSIAAEGTQSGDMVEVIQKMDIDNFGYGNNQANLATQVRRLAPIANASYTESAFSSFDLSLNAVDMRMSALRGDCCVSESDTATGLSRDSGFWLKGLGSYGKKKQHGEYDGYTTTEYGAAAGLDTHLNHKLVFGLAGSYAATDVKQQDFRYGDTMNIKNYQVTGYLSYDLTKAFYVDGAVSYGLNRYDGSRAAAVGRTADASFDGHQFGADFGIGYGIKLGSKTSFTPMASVDYKELKQDAYTETGAGAISLNLDEQAINRTRLGVGGRLATEWSNPGLTVCPEVALFWYHNTNALSKDIVSSFTGGGSSFVTPGVVLDPDTWNLSAALTASSRSAFSLQLRYDLDKRNEFMAHTGTVTARWGF